MTTSSSIALQWKSYDAAIINKLADITLFIIRGLLDRGMLPEIERFYTDKKYSNMSVVLNGTDGGNGRYG